MSPNIKKFLFIILLFATMGILIYSFFNKKDDAILNLPPEFYDQEKEYTNQQIDNQYPKFKVMKYLPEFFTNQYFYYRIYTDLESPGRLEVYLTPVTEITDTQSALEQTKIEVTDWIQQHESSPQDLTIDWYLKIDQNKTLINFQ